jgi:excisionase family DNA binding protein
MQATAPSAQKPITCTVQTTKHITGLGNTTIYELIKQGKLRTTAIGGRRLIFFDSIEALLRENAA